MSLPWPATGSRGPGDLQPASSCPVGVQQASCTRKLPFPSSLPLPQVAEELGFLYAASGPMVRSSYRAGEFYLKNMLRRQQEEDAAGSKASSG